MKTNLEFMWRVSWQYVDRSEMIAAVRGNEAWRDAILHSMQRIDDDDPDNITCSVGVETLDELRELLIATAGVKTPWGSALCLYAKHEPLSVHAALASNGEYESHCTMYRSPVKCGTNPAYDKLVKAAEAIREAQAEIEKGTP